MPPSSRRTPGSCASTTPETRSCTERAPSWGPASLRSPSASDLPDGARLIAFRDATDTFYRDLFYHIMNQMTEAVFICDSDNRILYLNDAALKMGSMDLESVRGAHNEDVYRMLDGSSNHVPEVPRRIQPHPA